MLVDPRPPGRRDDNLPDAVPVWLRQSANQCRAGQPPSPSRPATAVSWRGTLPQPGRRFVACGAVAVGPRSDRQEQSQRDWGPHVGAGCHRISGAMSLAETRCHELSEKPDQPGRSKESKPQLATVPRGVSSRRPPGRNRGLKSRRHWWPRVASLGEPRPTTNLRATTRLGPTWATVVGVALHPG